MIFDNVYHQCWDGIKTNVRTNIKTEKKLLTERQWAKLGYVAIDKNCGKQLWTNQYCKKKLLYLYFDEVRIATEYELSKFFRPEREKQKIKKQKKCIERRHKLFQELCKTIIDISNKDDMSKAETIIVDTETTGLDKLKDELLQVSIIDIDGKTLYNSYFKPLFCQQWSEAEKINHISPRMVLTAPNIFNEVAKINDIISHADTIIGYNTFFDLGFLEQIGCKLKDSVEIIDVMLDFAEIYGEWNDCYGEYKWQKLTTCADYYGFDWGCNTAHDSLSDCQATLHCYKQMIK